LSTVKRYEGQLVLTTGFLLLVQTMAALLASALDFLALRAPETLPSIVLDLSLTLILILTLWRTPSNGPPLLPAVPAVIPALAVYSVVGHSAITEAMVLISGISRLYLAVASLSLIVAYWRGISLGSDSTLIQLAIVAALVVLSGAVLTYMVESRDPRSPIKSLGEAIWWALETATTVGYGDVVPVTAAGRIIASLLMIFGIGSLGIFISDMAARIVKLALLGIEGGSIVDREKARIIRRLSRLEELSDAELELLISKLRLIHAITRGAGNIDLLELIDNESPVEATA